MIYLFDFSTTGVANFRHFLRATNYDGHIADILDVFVVPGATVSPNDILTVEYDVINSDGNVEAHASFMYIDRTKPKFDAIEYDFQFTKKLSFPNYQVRNNKCLCYPYNYLLVTNNVGTQNILKYEDFSSPYCTFKQQGALSIGGSFRTVPINYKGIEENVDESVPLAKFPTCQWSSDSYTNWLTQNAVNIEKQNMNIGYSGVKAATGFIGNLLSGNLGGALTSGIDSAQSLQNQIMDLQGGFYQAKLLPNLVGGSATAEVNFSSGDNNFFYYCMQCKPEYIKMIDSYFDKFGYKILKIKIPNYVGRNTWNFLQIGSGERFCYGDVPQSDLETINSIAQKGVTVWHDITKIGDYTQNNDVLPG